MSVSRCLQPGIQRVFDRSSSASPLRLDKILIAIFIDRKGSKSSLTAVTSSVESCLESRSCLASAAAGSNRRQTERYRRRRSGGQKQSDRIRSAHEAGRSGGWPYWTHRRGQRPRQSSVVHNSGGPVARSDGAPGTKPVRKNFVKHS